MRQGLRQQLLTTLLGVVLLALVHLVVIGWGLTGVRDQAIGDSEQALQEQADQYLLRLTDERANSTAQTLRAVQQLAATTRDYLTQAAVGPGQPLILQRGANGQQYHQGTTSAFVPVGADERRALDDLMYSQPLEAVIPALQSAVPEVIRISYLTANAIRTYPQLDLNVLPANWSPVQEPAYQASLPAQNTRRTIDWTTVHSALDRSELVISAVAPLYVSGTFSGTVIVDISLRRLTAYLSRLTVERTGFAFLVDGNGALVTATQEGQRVLLGQPIGGDMPMTIALNTQRAALRTMLVDLQSGRSAVTTVPLQERSYVLAYAPVSGIGWGLGLAAPLDEITTHTAETTRSIAAIANRTLAFVVGTTLIVLSLFGLMFRSEHRAREQAEWLQATMHTLSSTMDLGQVSALILRELQKVVPYDSASVQQLQGDRLEVIGGVGFPNLDELVGTRLDLTADDTPNQQVIRTQRPLILHNPAATYAEFRSAMHSRNPIGSWLGIPLRFEDRPIGMITLDKNEAGFYTKAHTRLAVAFANQAASAIEGARQYTAVQESRAIAESANRAKSIFLANMSHELRTPLNSILGFAQLMERDPALAPRQQEHLGIITRSGEHLLHLINDVLEMSKIEAGRVTLHDSTFDLHILLRSVQELFQLRAASKQIQLHFELAADLPQHVRGDESKLRQILINLLGNAVKFTYQGGVTLRAAWRDGIAGRQGDRETGRQEDSLSADLLVSPSPGLLVSRSSLVVEVEDTGVGIAADQLPSLFEAFVQTNSGADAQEGTGLGLAITREFVRLMGGDISASSTVGHGSLFRFEIQLAPAGPAELYGRAAERRVIGIAPDDRQMYRMLVVDDKWENRKLLVEWLSAAGFAVREASDGQEAIAEWARWAPQLIWMDMRMPILDGYAATRRIKATLKGQATVIIALTASAFEHEQAIVLDAGCDDFVRKPVRESVVFEKIAQHLGVQFIYDEPQARPAVPADGPLTPALLAAMPAEWVASLRQAVLGADLEQVKLFIGQIQDRDRMLADRLERMVDNFQIDQLMLLIQK